jgi:hypothetical protein
VGPISGLESISIIMTAAHWVAPERAPSPARTPTSLVTLRKTRSQIEPGIGRGRTRHGRVGQAFALVESGAMTGPPPIPRFGPPRATNKMTRPLRRSPPQEAARGIWIRAWGQREPALQGTGRSNDPARSLGLLEGGLDDPRHSRQNQLTLHRTPDLNVDVHRSGHSSVELGLLSFMR